MKLYGEALAGIALIAIALSSPLVFLIGLLGLFGVWVYKNREDFKKLGSDIADYFSERLESVKEGLAKVGEHVKQQWETFKTFFTNIGETAKKGWDIFIATNKKMGESLVSKQ